MSKRIKNKARSNFSSGNYQDYLLFCENTGMPYTIIESNYTITIVSDFCNIVFMQKPKQKQAFIAGAKIKRDILLTGLTPPEIDTEDLRYFNFSMPERLRSGKHTIYNIDIKSAYARVLKNHSLITPGTFGYMSRLSKENRLACVGMLAAKKEVFHMIGREVVKSEKIELESRNWFYFCVLRTNQIINECSRLITKDFLFYWVDGIFFDNEINAKKVGEKLKSLGYEYSFDVCTDFKYTEKSRVKKIEYYKGAEKKELFLPKKNDDVHKFLINFLKLHK